MALTDSSSGKVIREYSIAELQDAANLMRGYDLVALHAAGSGHAGGTLSIMDITPTSLIYICDEFLPNEPRVPKDRT
jgi:transketolase